MSRSLPRLRALAERWLPSLAAPSAAAAALRRPGERLRIGIAPERVALAGYCGRLRPQLARAESIAVEPRPGAPRWQAAVDALQAALARPGAPRCRATAILSNQLVRYALLPWNPTLRSQDEWLAYARHRMQAVHGAAIDDWDLRVCETAPSGARIVSAVDRALLDALDAAVAGTGGVVESVQPYLMSVFNRAPLAADRSCWLVIEEPGRLMLALIQDGAWRSIRVRRVDGSWRSELAAILERESAALGLERPCTEVAIHAEAELHEGGADGFRLLDLVEGGSAGARDLATVLR